MRLKISRLYGRAGSSPAVGTINKLAWFLFVRFWLFLTVFEFAMIICVALCGQKWSTDYA